MMFRTAHRLAPELVLLLLLLTCAGFTNNAHAEGAFVELAPFSSDGCSAFPNGSLRQKQLWLKCCVAHDYAYWQGGTYGQREDADKALEQCVAANGEPELAILMLAGVRVGGTPFLPTTFRWGYGWQQPRFYSSLNDEEKQALLQQDMGEDLSVAFEYARLLKSKNWLDSTLEKVQKGVFRIEQTSK